MTNPPSRILKLPLQLPPPFPHANHPCPYLLTPPIQRRIEHAPLKQYEFLPQLLFSTIHSIPPIPQHLRLSRQTQALMAQPQMLPSTLRSSYRDLQIVFLKQSIQTVIDLMQSAAKNIQSLNLHKHALAKFLKPFYKDRNGARARLLGESFFELCFFVVWSGAVEGGLFWWDGVVEVSAEESLGVLGVPFR